jgi:hypothetical protein
MPKSMRPADVRFGARRFLRVIPFGVVALTAVVGCFRSRPAPEFAGAVANTYTVPVTVESRFREDLTLFVLHDGIATRLIRVGSSSTTKLVIPAHLVGSLGDMILLVEGVGARSGSSERFTTGRLRVQPGQGIVWTLETRLERSFAQIVPAATLEPDTVK